MWQRICSAVTIADFPQLFGPTNTVRPAAGSMTVCSCDMKLISSIRLITGKPVEQFNDARDNVGSRSFYSSPAVGHVRSTGKNIAGLSRIRRGEGSVNWFSMKLVFRLLVPHSAFRIPHSKKSSQHSLTANSFRLSRFTNSTLDICVASRTTCGAIPAS